MCDSRCFGYSLPTDMLVPFADCANHHVVDMTVEIYNKRLHDLRQESDSTGIDFEFTADEKHYFTFTRMKFNYLKHFKEDVDKLESFKPVSTWTDNDIHLPYKTRR